MGKPALDVGQLSRDEQMQLLDELWGVLGRGPGALPLGDAQRGELGRGVGRHRGVGPAEEKP